MNDLNTFQSNLETLKKEVWQITKNKLDSIQAKLEKLDTDSLETLDKDLSELSQVVSGISSQVSSINSSVSNLQGGMDSINTDIYNISNTINNHTADISSLSSSVQKNESDISSLTTSVDNNTSSISEMSTTLDNVSLRTSQQSTIIDNICDSVGELKLAVNNIQSGGLDGETVVCKYLNLNGYIKYSSGLTMQWGCSFATNLSEIKFTFFEAAPFSAAPVVLASWLNDGTRDTYAPVIGNVTKDGFTLYKSGSGAKAMKQFWFAIGY